MIYISTKNVKESIFITIHFIISIAKKQKGHRALLNNTLCDLCITRVKWNQAIVTAGSK